MKRTRLRMRPRLCAIWRGLSWASSSHGSLSKQRNDRLDRACRTPSCRKKLNRQPLFESVSNISNSQSQFSSVQRKISLTWINSIWFNVTFDLVQLTLFTKTSLTTPKFTALSPLPYVTSTTPSSIPNLNRVPPFTRVFWKPPAYLASQSCDPAYCWLAPYSSNIKSSNYMGCRVNQLRMSHYFSLTILIFLGLWRVYEMPALAQALRLSAALSWRFKSLAWGCLLVPGLGQSTTCLLLI